MCIFCFSVGNFSFPFLLFQKMCVNIFRFKKKDDPEFPTSRTGAGSLSPLTGCRGTPVSGTTVGPKMK